MSDAHHNEATLPPCDCLNFCGDCPRLLQCLAEPCENRKAALKARDEAIERHARTESMLKAGGYKPGFDLLDALEALSSARAALPWRNSSATYSAIRARATRWVKTKGLEFGAAFDQSAQVEGYDDALHLIKIAVTGDPEVIKEFRLRAINLRESTQRPRFETELSRQNWFTARDLNRRDFPSSERLGEYCDTTIERMWQIWLTASTQGSHHG